MSSRLERGRTGSTPKGKGSLMAEDVEIMPPISNSEFQTWTSCHRKWYLSYYRGMGPKKSEWQVTGALSFGSRIHECLERMYTTGEDPLEVYEELHGRSVVELLQQESHHGFIDE